MSTIPFVAPEPSYEHGCRYMSCEQHTEADFCRMLDDMKNEQGWDLLVCSVVMRRPQQLAVTDTYNDEPEAAWFCVFRRERQASDNRPSDVGVFYQAVARQTPVDLLMPDGTGKMVSVFDPSDGPLLLAAGDAVKLIVEKVKSPRGQRHQPT